MSQLSLDASTYQNAIVDLRFLLRHIGRHDFRSYGYARQLSFYRRIVRFGA